MTPRIFLCCAALALALLADGSSPAFAATLEARGDEARKKLSAVTATEKYRGTEARRKAPETKTRQTLKAAMVASPAYFETDPKKLGLGCASGDE